MKDIRAIRLDQRQIREGVILRANPVTDQLELGYRKARRTSWTPKPTQKQNLSISRAQVRPGLLILLPGPTHPDLRASTMEISDLQLAAVISDNFSTQR